MLLWIHFKYYTIRELFLALGELYLSQLYSIEKCDLGSYWAEFSCLLWMFYLVTGCCNGFTGRRWLISEHFLRRVIFDMWRCQVSSLWPFMTLVCTMMSAPKLHPIVQLWFCHCTHGLASSMAVYYTVLYAVFFWTLVSRYILFNTVLLYDCMN